AYIDTLLFLEEEGASDSHGGEQRGAPESASAELEPDEAMTMAPESARPASPIMRAPAGLTEIGNALTTRRLTRLDMHIQGDRVHLSGLLDLKGLEELEKKISALKLLLAMNYEIGRAHV